MSACCFCCSYYFNTFIHIYIYIPEKREATREVECRTPIHNSERFLPRVAVRIIFTSIVSIIINVELHFPFIYVFFLEYFSHPCSKEKKKMQVSLLDINALLVWSTHETSISVYLRNIEWEKTYLNTLLNRNFIQNNVFFLDTVQY